MREFSQSEEIDRFLMASYAAHAAAEAGKEVKSKFLDEPSPKKDRVYFYACPKGSSVFDVERLGAAIESAEIPVLTDWDRKSDQFGLRYTSKDVEIPGSLRPFLGSEARTEWETYRRGVDTADRIVRQSARKAAQGKQLQFLDEVELAGSKPSRSGPAGLEM